jgi:hypothetical protein
MGPPHGDPHAISSLLARSRHALYSGVPSRLRRQPQKAHRPSHPNLQVQLRVPVGVVQDDGVGGLQAEGRTTAGHVRQVGLRWCGRPGVLGPHLQIEPHAARLEAEQEHEAGRACARERREEVAGWATSRLACVPGEFAAQCREGRLLGAPSVCALPLRAWLVEAADELAALRGRRVAVQARALEATPLEVLFDGVQRARHGAEQQHLAGEAGAAGKASAAALSMQCLALAAGHTPDRSFRRFEGSGRPWARAPRPPGAQRGIARHRRAPCAPWRAAAAAGGPAAPSCLPG